MTTLIITFLAVLVAYLILFRITRPSKKEELDYYNGRKFNDTFEDEEPHRDNLGI